MSIRKLFALLLLTLATACQGGGDKAKDAPPAPKAADDASAPAEAPPSKPKVADTPSGPSPLGEPGRASDAPNRLNNVYFGEQHLHTVNSPDAFAFGTRNTPDEAYRFCKGEAIKKNTTGETVQKGTPYDWCAVTDHAEYLGVMPLLLEKDNPLQDTPIGKLIATGDPKDGEKAFQQIIDSAAQMQPISYMVDPKLAKTVWARQKAAANDHYAPGKFTTFVAFEWSAQPSSVNLHHNVFFRDDAGPDAIFSAFDSVRREDLWSYQEAQRRAGHENFSIPHNGNVSNSMMYAPRTSDGNPINKRWAERSNRNTVATEIMQTKGASETHPALSPNDEFADFETGFKHLLGSGGVVGKIDHSYVRRALIDGVGFQEKIGANPFKYGIVAGADSHNAFSDNEEDNYTGVHGNTDKTPEIRLKSGTTVAGEAPKDFGTPGATGVWAPENTREAIFDAIKRKETFGTSGPLIRLRFFGGWGYSDELVKSQEFVKQAYAEGRADGRRSAGKTRGGECAPICGLGAEGPEERQSRPGSDRQRLVSGGAIHGKRSTTWLGRTTACSTRDWQASGRREHGEHQRGDLHQRHRRHAVERRLDRSGFRSVATRGVLRSGARNPNAPLVDVRRARLWGLIRCRTSRPPSRNAPGLHRSGTRHRPSW